MTPNWVSIAFFVLGLASLGLGIVAFTEGDTGYSVFKFALGIGWLMSGIFNNIRHRRSLNGG